LLGWHACAEVALLWSKRREWVRRGVFSDQLSGEVVIMDGIRFDDLTRTLAQPVSRRRVIRGGLASIALAFGVRRATAEAHTDCPDQELCGNKCCPQGSECCGSTCLTPQKAQTDPKNCGACGNVCPANAVCSGGACVCPSGQTACGAHCVDTNTDPHNCGACGHNCSAGDICVDGHCYCTDSATCSSNGHTYAMGRNACPYPKVPFCFTDSTSRRQQPGFAGCCTPGYDCPESGNTNPIKGPVGAGYVVAGSITAPTNQDAICQDDFIDLH
jgi:hypothetical protein